jgi:mannose-1-phosphate guanylyltransferase
MHCPGMLEQLYQAFDESTKDLQANALTTYPKELNDLSLGKSFSNAQSISIDYAVLEPRLSTIPTNAPSSC